MTELPNYTQQMQIDQQIQRWFIHCNPTTSQKISQNWPHEYVRTVHVVHTSVKVYKTSFIQTSALMTHLLNQCCVVLFYFFN